MSADNASSVKHPWSIAPKDLTERLQTDLRRGLTADIVTERQQQAGPNELRAKAGKNLLIAFIEQFLDFMIGLLFVAAIVSAFVGEYTDAVLIFLIVLTNGIIGFIQEQRAEAAVAALKQLSQPNCRGWRGGELVMLPARELVPGDVIELQAGDLAPADARLCEVHELTADESPLTGESLPVDKTIAERPAETALPERVNMVFAGTSIQQGRGRAIVTAIGMETELGHIARLLEGAETSTTPLEARLTKLSKQLAVAVIIVCILVFVVGMWRADPQHWNHAALEMFLVSISLAVAAVPEGLPAVITVALALGSTRMAKRQAIIRQLAAVETLGSVNIICSDKTGTLTQNKMQVEQIVPAHDGEQCRTWLARATVLCNNAEWSSEHGALGSATEAALLTAVAQQGFDPAELRQTWPREEEFPFSSARKRMSTLHRTPDGELVLFAKGAVEQILASAKYNQGADGPVAFTNEIRETLVDQQEALAAAGQRVLGMAYRTISADGVPTDAKGAEQDLIYLGCMAIVDPVRPEAAAAIAICRTAGIRPVMITGDHPATARSIAGQLKLVDEENELLTGPEVDEIEDEQLAEKIAKVSVFARVTPAHKLRIVKALQSTGSVVAMTGDGVNDAPALKQADIGVAMGKTGTDVSKEASKMVLADDNFATIVAAVEEGRVVYDNIRKFCRYLLTTNSCEVIVLFVAILVGLPIPLLPVHLLWINLVTDGLPALALAFEPAEPGIMHRRPRQRHESLFAHGLITDIVIMGLLMGLACVAIYYWYLPTDFQANGEYIYAQSMVFFVLAAFQLFYVLAIRSSTQLFLQAPLSNTVLLTAVGLGASLQLGVIYLPLIWPGAEALFHVVPLAWPDLLIAIGVASLAFVGVELRKLLLPAKL